MQRFLYLLLLCPTLFACGEAPRDATQTEDVAAAAGTDALPTEADQIEFTRNVDEATVAEDKLPPPEPVDAEVSVEKSAPSPVKTRQSVPKTDDKPAANSQRRKPAPPPPPAPVREEPPANTSADSAGNPVYNDGIGMVGSPPLSVPEPMLEEIPATGPPDHAAFDALLRAHVNDNGMVDYAKLKNNEDQLDAYLRTLAADAPDGRWNRNEKLAYWINAYNAFTLKLILDHYPVKSITNIDGGKPWAKKWIELEGDTYSLNQIEHDIIRPRFNEPRIHFALVCAAKSCPPLANRAYTAKNLDRMLITQTRAFLRNPEFNQTSGETLRVSKLFDWYAEDFGDVKTYLNQYLPTPVAADAELRFMDYDWNLNKQ